MTSDEILVAYRAMSTAYHAEPDKEQALAAYNAACENLLAASGIDREDFGYLLANGELPKVPEATE